MTLLRVLHAETLKLKRTIALPMAAVAPALIALLVYVMGVNAPFTTLNRNGQTGEWAALMRAHLRYWAPLMLPLLITLETALLAGLEHSESQWKSLLARPLPRWNFYVAKLLVGVALTAASSAVLVAGMLVDGAILPHFQHELIFAAPLPWAEMVRLGAEALCLAFPLLVIQNWVALRWRSFSVALGVGMVGLVVGLFLFVAGQQNAKELQLFPWSLPMLVLGNAYSLDVSTGVIFSVAVGMAAAAAGCWEFCRREVQ
jgi:hypothetical protein